MIICAYVRDQSVPHAVADGIANKEVQKREGMRGDGGRGREGGGGGG